MTLKFPAIGCILVAFPQLLVLFFPIRQIEMTEKNQFWNHYLREQHKLFFFHFTTISHRVIKSRTDDSIHSRSTASKVETRRHHRRCELVAAVFLNHLGFCNQSRCCWMCVQVAWDIQVSTVSAGTHHVPPVSGLQVFQCPEGVSSVPHRGPVLVPGTMLGHGSEYLRSSKVT